VVEQSHRAIRASNRKDVFKRSNRVWNPLRNLDVPVETIRNVFEKFHMHQAATRSRAFTLHGLELILVCLRHQLARLLNHLLGNLFEGALILVDYLE
jgi:hypothetical protein